MRADAQALLDVLVTPAAFLRGEARRDSDDLMTSSLSLILKDTEKRAPTRVVNALGQRMVLYHPCHVQVFDIDVAVSLRIVLRDVVMMMAALARDLEMLARDFPRRLVATMAALRATAQRALRVREALLSSAVVARILDHAAVGVGQEHFQTHIQPNGRMVAFKPLRMHDALLILRRRLADDQRIPMVVGAQYQMRRHWRAHQRAVHLDLEQLAEFGGYMQVRAVVIQPDIPAHSVLAQLDAVPAVGHFEAGKATGQAHVFQLKRAFERLAQPVGECLHRGRGHSLTATALEARRQVVLRGERAIRLVLRFQGRQHLIVDGPRSDQAGHQLLALCAGGIQSVLERPHILMIPHRIRMGYETTNRWYPRCLRATGLSPP